MCTTFYHLHIAVTKQNEAKQSKAKHVKYETSDGCAKTGDWLAFHWLNFVWKMSKLLIKLIEWCNTDSNYENKNRIKGHDLQSKTEFKFNFAWTWFNQSVN